MSPKFLNPRNIIIIVLVGVIVLQLTGVIKIPNLFIKRPTDLDGPIGGCAGTEAGCCDDNVTQCDCTKPRSLDCQNCNC